MFTTPLPAQFPRLETGRLVLREITPGDRETIFNTYADEQVTRYIMQPLTRLEQADEVIQAFQDGYQQGKSIFWGVALKGEERLAGSVSLENIQWDDQRAEVAYDLGRDYWGKGIMSEALQAALEFGFI